MRVSSGRPGKRSSGVFVIRRMTVAALCWGCGQPEKYLDRSSAHPELISLRPITLVPGTEVALTARNLVEGSHQLALQLGGQVYRFAAEALDAGRLRATVAGLPEGDFRALTWIERDDDKGDASPLDVDLRVANRLEPSIERLAMGPVFLDQEVSVLGADFLLGGSEGSVVTVINGCFTRDDSDGCSPVHAELLAVPQDPFARDAVHFAFSPTICGIQPGVVIGTAVVENRHHAGDVTQSAEIPIQFELRPPALFSVEPREASLGQFVSFTGGGFVRDGGDVVSMLQFDGTVAGAPVVLTLFPEPLDSAHARYVVDESDALGRRVDLRAGGATMSGVFSVVVQRGDERVVGNALSATLTLRPPRQVVKLDFLPGYVDGLREFGVQALDEQIRARVVDVVKRDFVGVAVDVRTETPTDFALYSLVEIGGEDPNGLGLIGNDNSAAKDVGNLRLHDRLGGLNALAQWDGAPGYGGVFVSSMLEFIDEPLFRAIFDSLRPSAGGLQPTWEEAARISVLSDGASCPAQGRQNELACAAFVLGNLIGSTVSHEIGHSLGLADPYGPLKSIHNPGDAPKRLMDSGSHRPFAERAELDDAGPAQFCTQEFMYLQTVLPEDATASEERPSCE